jgi:hypothetical protein
LITRDHLAPKLAAVYAGKKGNFALRRVIRIVQQYSADLRHRLNHQYSWHHPIRREMPLEKRFIERHVFDPNGVLVPHNFQNTIDEDKRIPMWQQRQYLFRPQ